MTFTLLDGGMGKLLQAQGAPFRQPEWSALALLEAPDEVAKAHRAFVDAGADLITTSNYAVVPFHLGAERFDTDGARLTSLAGQLARQVADSADRPVMVAGSIPPVFGSYQPESFRPDAAPPLLSTIVSSLDPFVDHWICETQSSIDEALASMAAASVTGKPVWVGFTLTDEVGPEPATLRSGESVSEAVAAVIAAGASAVLFNCSQPEVMQGAIDTAVAQSPQHVAVGAYGNSFDHEKGGSRQDGAKANEALLGLREDLDEVRYRRIVEGWIKAGATIVGGCCGIMPAHIAEIAKLRELSE